MDQVAKREVLRMFTYGLYALTVPEETGGHGATVNWVTQTSFEPPMIAVSIEKNSHCIELIRKHGVFAINVYKADQRDLAGTLGRRYANRPDKFQGVAWAQGITGAPVLSDALGHLECRITGEVDSGDSVLFVAQVVEAGVQGQGLPLTMQASGFKHAG